MTYVRDFYGYKPAPRGDGLPWTQARIQEAPNVSGAPGSWTTLETQTLSPVDTDPAAPRERDLTTTLATLTAGWYRIVFLDAAGDQDLTDPKAYPPTDQPYFTPAELRARFSEITSPTYSDSQIETRRQEVEERLERLCNVAFVPRTATETLSGTGTRNLQVTRNKPRSIITVANSGIDLDVSAAALTDAERFYLPAGWTTGVGNLAITYTHGYDEPPHAVKEAAMLWTRELLVPKQMTERATQISTEGGVINLATPGLFGSTTGYPTIDEIIAEYRYPTVT